MTSRVNSRYTDSVKHLVEWISGSSEPTPSLYQDAAEYFAIAPKAEEKLASLQRDLDRYSATHSRSSNQQGALDRAKQKLEAETNRQQKQRVSRLNTAMQICKELLALSEGESFEETQFKSAKLLSIIVMLSPGEGPKLAELHQSLKPAYKAVLSLRLLDKMLLAGFVKNPYILRYYVPSQRYDSYALDRVCFHQSVVLPVMLAAIFQDVGLQHPRLQKILQGEDGKLDRFRLLDNDERTEMLRLNYQYTLDYLNSGLGAQDIDAVSASGVDPSAITDLIASEQKRLKWQAGLIENANSTKMGTSEIIKVPQIYASVVFSTKRDFVKSSLPTGALLIKQLAVKKQISQPIADSFISIVGHFPLGYGVVYIPQDIRGSEVGTYEYAIVTGLNPLHPEEPVCRSVSKNQLFMDYSTSEIVDKTRNLHFPKARQKLEKIDPKRLQEILEKLTYGFKPEQMDQLLPTFWDPHRYFCVSGNQNLWSRSG